MQPKVARKRFCKGSSTLIRLCGKVVAIIETRIDDLQPGKAPFLLQVPLLQFRRNEPHLFPHSDRTPALATFKPIPAFAFAFRSWPDFPAHHPQKCALPGAVAAENGPFFT